MCYSVQVVMTNVYCYSVSNGLCNSVTFVFYLYASSVFADSVI